MADLNRRQTAVNSLREAQRFIDGNDFVNAPVQRLRLMSANVRRTANTFDEIHDRLIGAQIPQPEFDEHERLKTEIQAMVLDLETKLLVQIGVLDPPAIVPVAAPVPAVPVQAAPAAQNAQEMRYLLTQKVENTWGEFDGTLSKWKTFRQMFTSAIHEAGYLTNEFKFQQLIKSLKGEAVDVLEGWEITAENYPLAWERLNKVFHLPHVTVTKLINKLSELPKIERANRKQLQHLSNVANSVKLQMNGLGHNTEQCDIMFLATLENKLDRFTRREWEITRENEPTFVQFLAFIDKQARVAPDVIIDVAKPNKVIENHKRRNDGKSQSFPPPKKFRTENQRKPGMKFEKKKEYTKVIGKCPVKECGLTHFLYRCPNYLARDRDEREKFLRSNKLCINCLLPGHFARFCSENGCYRCDGKKHNSTICSGNQFLSKANMVKLETVKEEQKTD